jgi:calpain-7
MSAENTLQFRLRDLRDKYQEPISRQDSLALAIEAAEIHLKCLKLSSSTVEKKALREKTIYLFDEAEKLKGNPNYAPARPIQELVFGAKHDRQPTKEPVHSSFTNSKSIPPAVRLLSPPQSTRELPISEQRLILEASRLNAAIFPPWKPADDAEQFDTRPEGDIFT